MPRGISGYRVFRDGGATPVATVQTTSYTDTGLTAGTAYSYAVAAVDSAATPNASAVSASVSATTPTPPDTTAPTVPAGVTAVAQSASSILVSWTASTDASGISGYRVFRAGVGCARGNGADHVVHRHRARPEHRLQLHRGGGRWRARTQCVR